MFEKTSQLRVKWSFIRGERVEHDKQCYRRFYHFPRDYHPVVFCCLVSCTYIPSVISLTLWGSQEPDIETSLKPRETPGYSVS